MNVNEVISNYDRELKGYYHMMASKIQELISSILSEKGIVPHSITYRAKDSEKLKEKIRRGGKEYADPLKDITDLAGVRVITYFPSDVERIIPHLRKEFVVDEKDSIDKRKKADPSSFGYSSVHLVVKFSSERKKLPEYKTFIGKKCEIQVRTILQHAWAEIEHDISYKTTEDIPFELRRRFASLSGLLEIADREFESLRKDQDRVRERINKRIKDDQIDISINFDSLRFYLDRFHKEKDIRTESLSNSIKLLKYKNIYTIKKLDRMLTKNALDAAEKELRNHKNICSVSEQKWCLMHYFLAIARSLKISTDELKRYAPCPIIKYKIYNFSRISRS